MSSSAYAMRMASLSARVFGEVARPISNKSRRVVNYFSEKPWDLRHNQVGDYYPPHHEWSTLIVRLRAHGLFRDEHLDFKYEMKRLRALRGKVPPKKGEGRRTVIEK